MTKNSYNSGSCCNILKILILLKLVDCKIRAVNKITADHNMKYNYVLERYFSVARQILYTSLHMIIHSTLKYFQRMWIIGVEKFDILFTFVFVK